MTTFEKTTVRTKFCKWKVHVLDSTYDEILRLTKQLVAIPSVNGTDGERNVACFIEKYLRKIPYFERRPGQVVVQELRNDPLKRENVFALLKGEKGKSKDTILLHGHMDTVGVDDYGALKPYAFDCDGLKERLSGMPLPKEVRADLDSGDWLFGRGACDMKGGVAVFLVLLKKLSEHVEEMEGNILLSVNPVEENSHTGILQALDFFEKLRAEENLRYLFAINNDYICPAFPGDRTKYVYAGTVGKLLPCFYIFGRETHVGQCFEGFDASLFAAELVKEISLNPDFCDSYRGEYTPPPSVLKIKDLKPQYNVQTAFSAFVYFNFFVHDRPVQQTVKMLKAAAASAFERVTDTVNGRFRRYCSLSGTRYIEKKAVCHVLDYAELFSLAQKKHGGSLAELTRSLAEKLLAGGLDQREIALKITQRLCEIAEIKAPAAVLFFAAPYLPHNTLHEEIPAEKELMDRISSVMESCGKENGETYRMLRFFPSLSDSSYLKIDDDSASLEALIQNFPEYGTVYPLPLRQIKHLNIPALDYGCFGKDAHKWTERVYAPYSFGVLPRFLIETLEEFLMKSRPFTGKERSQLK